MLSPPWIVIGKPLAQETAAGAADREGDGEVGLAVGEVGLAVGDAVSTGEGASEGVPLGADAEASVGARGDVGVGSAGDGLTVELAAPVQPASSTIPIKPARSGMIASRLDITDSF